MREFSQSNVVHFCVWSREGIVMVYVLSEVLIKVGKETEKKTTSPKSKSLRPKKQIGFKKCEMSIMDVDLDKKKLVQTLNLFSVSVSTTLKVLEEAWVVLKVKKQVSQGNKRKVRSPVESDEDQEEEITEEPPSKRRKSLVSAGVGKKSTEPINQSGKAPRKHFNFK